MAEKKMKRLTTDNPRGNFQTMLNMVYPGDDGWSNIRHGEDGMPIVDFCFGLCEKQGCDVSGMKDWSAEDKDAYLCDCCFESCPVATVYAAMCGYSHVRSRLKMYEDAGLSPNVRYQPENRVLTLDEVCGSNDPCVFVEQKDVSHILAADFVISALFPGVVEASTTFCSDKAFFTTELYGKVWRCWNGMPTDEDRKAVAWDE